MQLFISLKTHTNSNIYLFNTPLQIANKCIKLTLVMMIKYIEGGGAIIEMIKRIFNELVMSNEK